MSEATETARDARIEAIADKITRGIYHAPFDQATSRQKGIALMVAGNIAAIGPDYEALRHRAALIAIRAACEDGRVCDDVPWFDRITTLFDFVEETLNPSQPAAVGDLFEGATA